MAESEFDDFCRRLDVGYLEQTLRPICELAEDLAPWGRLQRVLAVIPPQSR